MYHNVKVDLIYHNTPADYEMEFNLCGCCRMRLLSEKTTDTRSFLRGLAQAVDRSRVILVAGPMFNEGGTLSTIANAIGRPLKKIDSAAYGIQSAAEIQLVDGATPLVTDDGYLAGCIIESGPQVMIVLSENKTLRKSVMNSLIHPYISEIAADNGGVFSLDHVSTNSQPDPSPMQESTPDEPVTEKPPVREPVVPAPVSENKQLFSSDESEIERVTLEEAVPKHLEKDTTLPESKIQHIDDTDLNTPETDKKSNPPRFDEFSKSLQEEDDFILDLNDESSSYEENDDYIIDTDKSSKKNRAAAIQANVDFVMGDTNSNFHYDSSDILIMQRRRITLPILILIIVLLVILASLIFLMIYIPLRSGISPIQYLKAIFTQLIGSF